MKINPKTGRPLTEADIISFGPASAEPPQLEPDDGPDPSAVEPPDDAGDTPEPQEPHEPPPAREPSLVDLQLGGRTIRVAPEVAEAYRAEINRRDGIRGNELQKLREELAELRGQVRTQPQPPAQPAEPTGPKLPDPALNITDPDEYQRQLVEFTEHRVRTEIKAAEERARQEMAQATEEQRRAAEWSAHVDNFYKNNPELSEARDVVDAMWNRHKLEWKDYSVEDAFKELATVSKTRLAELSRAGKVVGAPRSKPPAVEGSRARGSAAAAPDAADEGPRTITAYLRERRAARQAALGAPPAKQATSR